jgi:DNA-binding CsgD family transcriptional regulator
VHIVWQALGAIIIAHSLPRFLLSAFGTAPRPFVYRLLDAATLVIAILSIVRAVTGWNELAAGPALLRAALRVLLFALIAGALGLTIVFQSRLPDRSLYKTTIAQICALSILLPMIILEDFGLISFAGFANLGGLILIGALSISTMLHARSSFMRPKYVVDDAPSSYFAERFGISDRELEVVSALLQGLGNAEIADRLYISPRTVENHLYKIYQKTGMNEPRSKAARYRSYGKEIDCRRDRIPQSML